MKIWLPDNFSGFFISKNILTHNSDFSYKIPHSLGFGHIIFLRVLRFIGGSRSLVIEGTRRSPRSAARRSARPGMFASGVQTSYKSDNVNCLTSVLKSHNYIFANYINAVRNLHRRGGAQR